MKVLVLAAGIGRRYGGDKQIASLGPQGAWLVDYACYDALCAGFKEIVFVVRASLRDRMEAHLSSRWSKGLTLSFVIQEKAPSFRAKPWGTAHAVRCAAPALQGPFALINADDFYGPQAFVALAEQLKSITQASNTPSSTNNKTCERWGMVAYRLKDTLSAHGTVSRGVCKVDGAGFLQNIKEHTQLRALAKGGDIQADQGSLAPEALVSMNAWAFGPSLFELLEQSWNTFQLRYGTDPQAEHYLPEVVAEALHKGKASVRVVPTNSEWMGITYAAEGKYVQARLAALHAQGQYPARLCATEVPVDCQATS